MNLRRKTLIVTGAVFGVAILLPVFHHYQLRLAEASYIAKLKAKGEPLELAQVLPPPVPPEQNSASNFLKAVALFKADKSLLETNEIFGMKMVAPGKATSRFQLANAEGDWATNSWADVAAAVRQNHEAFDLLHQLTVHPHLDFQIHYERGFGNGFDINDMHLAETKRMAQSLETKTMSDLHEGDTASAVKDLRAMLALAKSLDDERFIISELVQMAIAAMAVPGTWDVLQSPNLTDEQLAQLQGGWNTFDFLQGDENALDNGTRDGTRWTLQNGGPPIKRYSNCLISGERQRSQWGRRTRRQFLIKQRWRLKYSCGDIGGLIRMNCAA